MKTQVTEMLGVEHPILAFSHVREVVAEVTRGGGFGVLGVVGHTADHLETDLQWLDEVCEGKPYGVDLLLPSKYEGADQGGLDADSLRQLIPPAQIEFVEDILARYGVPPLPPDTVVSLEDAARFEVSPAGYQPLLDVAFGHPIRLIASALGAPPDYLVERAHDADVLVAALAGTVTHAQRHAAIGSDLIVAQGTEAGGHTGEIGTIVLVPDVVDAVRPLPVVAAGGILDGRQIAAALALGAEAVWCGSAWLATPESETPPGVREKFVAASAADTVRSRALTGKPARMLRSAWTDEWASPDAPEPLMIPLQNALVAEAQQRIQAHAQEVGSGANQLANYFVGQVVGRIRQVEPTRAVLDRMVAELDEALATIAEKARQR